MANPKEDEVNQSRRTFLKSMAALAGAATLSQFTELPTSAEDEYYIGRLKREGLYEQTVYIRRDNPLSGKSELVVTPAGLQHLLEGNVPPGSNTLLARSFSLEGNTLVIISSLKNRKTPKDPYEDIDVPWRQEFPDFDLATENRFVTTWENGKIIEAETNGKVEIRPSLADNPTAPTDQPSSEEASKEPAG